MIASRRIIGRKPVIAITMGDFNGIGPEIALKSVLTPSIRKLCLPILLGTLDVFEYYARRLKLKINLQEVESVPHRFPLGSMLVLDVNKFHKPRISPGRFTLESGRYAGEAIKRAVSLWLDKKVDGIVTAPVSKEAMDNAGYRYPGQTEMLADLSQTTRFAMMLVAGKFRVGLATVHLPLKDVAGSLSKQKILDKLSIVDESLKRDFAIHSPRIAVLGLNPHAGENGILGDEERKWIEPAIRLARKNRIDTSGPFSADGFFGAQAHMAYDAVLAMYHDQGLIPLKMSGFSIGVNYSAGFPLVRTSPDHGTAFDLAGKGIADHTSMIEAIKLAVRIIHNRKRVRTR